MSEIGAPKMPAPATVKLHTIQSMLEESSRTMRARAITFVRWILRRSNMIISDRSIRLIGKVSHGLNPIEYKRGQARMTLATKLAGIWACPNKADGTDAAKGQRMDTLTNDRCSA